MSFCPWVLLHDYIAICSIKRWKFAILFMSVITCLHCNTINKQLGGGVIILFMNVTTCLHCKMINKKWGFVILFLSDATCLHCIMINRSHSILESNYMPTLQYDKQNVGSLSFCSWVLLYAYFAIWSIKYWECVILFLSVTTWLYCNMINKTLEVCHSVPECYYTTILQYVQ